MSTLAASNSDEPPPSKSTKLSSSPPSPFSSLPSELVLEIVARVPRKHHPIISCVSKTFLNLVRSPQFQKTRSRLGLDSLYICFNDEATYPNHGSIDPKTLKWYTLENDSRHNNNLFTSIKFPTPPDLIYSSLIAIGPEIYFIGGTVCDPSSSLWIFDSRSNKFRGGPEMFMERGHSLVGLIGGDKIYVIGWIRDNGVEFVAESFDMKRQVWEGAPAPEEEEGVTKLYVSLGNKVYWLIDEYMFSYDTRDGSCERYDLPADDEVCGTGLCVIQNVIYAYFSSFGLMWLNTEVMSWRMVDGLSRLEEVEIVDDVGMGEYYGKMALLWKGRESEEVWCRMIDLDRSDAGIHGTAEPDQLLGTVPHNFRMHHCLSLTR